MNKKLKFPSVISLGNNPNKVTLSLIEERIEHNEDLEANHPESTQANVQLASLKNRPFIKS